MLLIKAPVDKGSQYILILLANDTWMMHAYLLMPHSLAATDRIQ